MKNKKVQVGILAGVFVLLLVFVSGKFTGGGTLISNLASAGAASAPTISFSKPSSSVDYINPLFGFLVDSYSTPAQVTVSVDVDKNFFNIKNGSYYPSQAGFTYSSNSIYSSKTPLILYGTALAPGVTYYYKGIVTDANGTASTSVGSFTTNIFQMALVKNITATSITSNSATFSAIVEPYNQQATVHFEYGLSPKSSTPNKTINSNTTVTNSVTGLKSKTTYTLTVVTTPTGGTVPEYSDVVTFTTK